MALEPITRQEQIISGKDLKPITRMEKFLKDYGGGGSGGGSQPDWNQNDPTKPDYVKNRTHWTDEKTIFERQTVNGFDDVDDYKSIDFPGELDVSASDVVQVFWDGTNFNCTCHVAEDGAFYLGNLSITNDGEDTGEPFLIVSCEGQTEICTPSGTSHSVGITKEATHKIDPKYLPESVPITDISGKVADGSFDFISAGQGLYFSSTSIDFRFLAWDENYENYDEQRTNCSGLFIVSYTPDNGWCVFSVNAMALFSQFGETPIVEGSYDQCLRVSLNPAQPM